VARFSAHKNAQYVFSIAYPAGWSKSIAAPLGPAHLGGDVPGPLSGAAV
jgi:hypothetical protein